jgi:hypothetical protein
MLFARKSRQKFKVPKYHFEGFSRFDSTIFVYSRQHPQFIMVHGAFLFFCFRDKLGFVRVAGPVPPLPRGPGMKAIDR